MPELWSSPIEEPQGDASPESAKFKFGPRVARVRPRAESEGNSGGQRAPEVSQIPKEAGSEPNLNHSSKQLPNNLVTKYLSSINAVTTSLPYSENASANIPEALSVLRQQVAELEKERDKYRERVEVLEKEGTLDTMVIEIELETLREEVARLKAVTATPVSDSSSRVTDLESTISSLKKERAAMESKYISLRNADQARIRALEEQVANEKRMRDRMAAMESSMPVVSVPSSGNAVILRPKPAPIDEAATTIVLPNFKADHIVHHDVPDAIYSHDLGSDDIGILWKKALSEKPSQLASIVTRLGNTNNFKLGTKDVTCRKVGNVVMVQCGQDTKVLERFIDMYSEEELPVKASISPISTTVVPSVTLKGLKAKTAQNK